MNDRFPPQEMIEAMQDSIWREAYKATELRDHDLLFNAAINIMHLKTALKLYKKED